MRQRGKRMRNRTTSRGIAAGFAAILAASLLMAGCGGGRRHQLERVAKDWCETIRASQVIPVYPLTEDIEPGDVFLVQTSIQAETDIYKRKGFLPLDDRRARIRDAGYAEVYRDGYWDDTWGQTPHPRRDRAAGAVASGPEARLLLSLADAPRVAFPSYSFEVRRGGAFGLAIPIKGVPVGLSYLRSDRVTGTVTIADARTYAGDAWTLYSGLDTWVSENPQIRRMLSDTVDQAGRPVFLRVVSRVYLTGAVVVGMHSQTTVGAGASAGAPPDVKIINDDGSVNENFKAALDAISQAADPSPTQAGGRVQFVQASSRDIVLAESFDRLLAIGYLGFDVPVFQGGVLGAPIPTYERLEGLAYEPTPPAGRLTPAEVSAKMLIASVAGQPLQDAPTVVAHDAPEAQATAAARARKAKERSLGVITRTAEIINTRPFADAASQAKAAAAIPAGDAGFDAAFASAATSFERAANMYAAADGAGSVNDRRLADAIERAYGLEYGLIKP